MILLRRWPQKNVFSKTDTGPLPEIYHAFYFSIYESASINQYGNATTSQIKAIKIWSIGRGKINHKTTHLGMVLHRITGVNSFCFYLLAALVCPWLYCEWQKKYCTGKVTVNFIHYLTKHVVFFKIWSFYQGVVSICVFDLFRFIFVCF